MRYFDKSFFKFTLGFLVIIAVSLLVIAAVSAFAAGVEQIVFTTDSQSIGPDELSGPITIQTQDSSGALFQTPETVDLEFISTSPTGQFLRAAGKPAQKYMNKNTANRTFYYKDPAEGSFEITVMAKPRSGVGEWSARQVINVSSNINTSSNSENSEPTKTEPLPTADLSSAENKDQIATTSLKEQIPEKEITEVKEVKKDKPKEIKTTQAAAAIVSKEEAVLSVEISSTTPDVNLIYETPKKESWWRRLWNFLVNIFN